MGLSNKIEIARLPMLVLCGYAIHLKPSLLMGRRKIVTGAVMLYAKDKKSLPLAFASVMDRWVIEGNTFLLRHERPDRFEMSWYRPITYPKDLP